MELFRNGSDAPYGAPKQSRQIHQPSVSRQGSPFERGVVRPGNDPGLIRHSRGVRAKRDKIPADLNNALVLPQLLGKNVAKNAPLLRRKVVAAGTKFIQHAPRNEGGGGQLRVRVLKLLSRVRAVVLEHADVLEALIAFQILHALRGQDQEAFDLCILNVPDMAVMTRVLHQNFMRPSRRHAVVEAIAAAGWLTFNTIERMRMHKGTRRA